MRYLAALLSRKNVLYAYGHDIPTSIANLERHLKDIQISYERSIVDVFDITNIKTWNFYDAHIMDENGTLLSPIYITFLGAKNKPLIVNSNRE